MPGGPRYVNRKSDVDVDVDVAVVFGLERGPDEYGGFNQSSSISSVRIITWLSGPRGDSDRLDIWIQTHL